MGLYAARNEYMRAKDALRAFRATRGSCTGIRADGSNNGDYTHN